MTLFKFLIKKTLGDKGAVGVPGLDGMDCDVNEMLKLKQEVEQLKRNNQGAETLTPSKLFYES